jgi:Holliday junction resolvasome RuvABC endonuclease subunit
LRASKTLLGKSKIKEKDIVVGIDAQPRGLAIGAVTLDGGEYFGHLWIPFDKDPHEKMIHLAYIKAEDICSKILPSIVTVEQPTARRSSSTAILWGIYGAVVAGAYSHCDICESIVVPQWKSLSGLNRWAKESGTIAKGFVPKESIPLGMQTILGVSDDLMPLDLYDALGIAYASFLRNQDRVVNGKSRNLCSRPRKKRSTKSK